MEQRRYTKTQIKNIAEGVLESYSDGEFPVKVLQIAKNLELEVYDATFDKDDVAGMLKAKEKKILIAQSDSPLRQRFSIAHEIGHYVLHYYGKLFEEKDQEKHISFRDNTSSLGFSVREIEANFFAANLLMPEAKIRELYSGGFSMEEMAYFLNVSKIAMGHRLEYLGLIDE
ncbi:ImmA/IrrE family metallo-endopeptidase [uncultured Helicobacter sp.]|uniref:ImmA/IrrE family metallo-endopeptidase n=1 Tax=uncultured Helicobacter sp. TaxID=175537 RepID=UPI00374FD259